MGEPPGRLFGTALRASVGHAPDRHFPRRGRRLRVRKPSASAPDPALPTHRLGIAVIGQGVPEERVSALPQAAPAGHVLSRKSDTHDGLQVLLDAVAARAKAHPVPYGHWYIDGGAGSLAVPDGMTRVSYGALCRRRARRCRAACRRPTRRRLRSRSLPHHAGAA